MRRSVLAYLVVVLSGCDPEGDVLDEALVAHFGFDESTGTAVEDSSGRQNDGAFCQHGAEGSGCVAGEGPTRAEGKHGKALVFDGIDDGVNVPFDDSLQLAQLTIEAWVSWKGDNGAQQRILERARPQTSSTQTDYGLSLTAEGKPMVELRLGALPTDIKAVTSDKAVTVDTWTHVVAAYDGAEIVVYVNGTAENHLAATGPLTYLSSDVAPPPGLGMGNQLERNRPLKGLLDEVRIYDRGLTASEVRRRYETSAE
jgi:hypothetical protein